MATKTTASAAKKNTTKTAANVALKKTTKAPAKASRSTGTKATTKPRTASNKPAPTATKKAAPAAKSTPRVRKTDATEAFFVSFSTAASTPEATVPEAARKARVPRADSAQARVVAMMSAPEGTTLDAIMSATGWQAHTVRGFVSGTAKKKLGLAIESARVEGKRSYRVLAA